MAISVECSACFHQFRVSDNNAGKSGKCPECGAQIRVPGGGGAGKSTRSAVPPPVAGKPSRSKSRSKSSAGGNTGLLLGLGGVVVVLLGVVGFLLTRGSTDAPANATNPVEIAGNGTPTASAPDALPSTATVPATATATEPTPPAAASTPDAVAAVDTARASSPLDMASAKPAVAATPAIGTATVPESAAPAALPLLPSPEALSPVELVKRVEPSVVRINALSETDELEWHGSGFLIDATGLIATNHHVVAGAHKCVAEFASGKSFEVKGYYTMDEKRDIALIQVELPAGEFQPLPMIGSAPAKGEQVLAFGCPYGLDFSTTDGLISAFRSAADIKTMLGADVEGEWLQTSAPISPGNSGGPLVNMKGEVVGINSMVRSEGQNLNFAVAASEVKSMMDSRGEQLTALSRGTEAKDGNVSLGGSRAAERFLATVTSVHLLVRQTGDDAPDGLTEAVETYAKKHLRAADVGVTGIQSVTSPALVITVEAQDGVEQGTADVAIAAQLLVPTIVNGRIRILIVWETREEVGSPKKYKFRKDPKGELQEGLSRFFQAMENKFKAAKKSAG